MADSHAVFGTEPNCCRPVCLQSTFPKDDHAEAQRAQRHNPPPPRSLRLCVITSCQYPCLARLQVRYLSSSFKRSI